MQRVLFVQVSTVLRRVGCLLVVSVLLAGCGGATSGEHSASAEPARSAPVRVIPTQLRGRQAAEVRYVYPLAGGGARRAAPGMWATRARLNMGCVAALDD